MKQVAIFLLFLNLFTVFYLNGEEFLPHHIYDFDKKSDFSPFDFVKKEEPKLSPFSLNPLSDGFLFIFKFYQEILSPIDGPKCPYYPTCSQFGIEAVKNYGPFWGLLMLFNRQMREYPNLARDKWYPLVIKYGVLRVYDPPYRAYLWSEMWEK